VQRDYAPKGVKFYYIYKALAHPENDGYVQPFTLKERLMHVKEAQRTLGSDIPWICDSMSNELKHALGSAPNSEFVIDPEGKVVVSRSWSKPSELRKDLEKLIGPVEKPTRIADLNLKTEPPPKLAASGVVPRIKVPGAMQPLKIVPKPGKQPFYVKLRAEADYKLLRSGEGTLYVGFYLDPLYHVHWNNLAKPVKYEITGPDGTTISPAKGEGPKVKEAADIDPREFLVEIKRDKDAKGPLQLTVSYFACNDEQGWCKLVSQEYTIHLERDRDGGSVRSRGRGRGGRGIAGGSGNGTGRPGGFGPPGGAGRPSPADFASRIMSNDKNGDGKVTKDELPDFLQRILDRADTNKDGAIDKAEAKKMAERFGGGRGRPSGAGRRPGARPEGAPPRRPN
jgi:hypothetical protein